MLLITIAMSLITIIAGFSLVASLTLLIWIKDKIVLLWSRLASKVSINDMHIYVHQKDQSI